MKPRQGDTRCSGVLVERIVTKECPGAQAPPGSGDDSSAPTPHVDPMAFKPVRDQVWRREGGDQSRRQWVEEGKHVEQ